MKNMWSGGWWLRYAALAARKLALTFVYVVLVRAMGDRDPGHRDLVRFTRPEAPVHARTAFGYEWRIALHNAASRCRYAEALNVDMRSSYRSRSQIGSHPPSLSVGEEDTDRDEVVAATSRKSGILHGLIDVPYGWLDLNLRDWAAQAAATGSRRVRPPGMPQLNDDDDADQRDARRKPLYTPLWEWMEGGAWKRLSDLLVTEIAARWPETFDRGGRP